MKKVVSWLQTRKDLLLYMRVNRIKLQCVFKKAMMKKTGIGPGIAISFMFRDVLETPQGDPKIFKYRPASRFAGVTKKKALSLLNLSSDSSVGDCENINTEIEKY